MISMNMIYFCNSVPHQLSSLAHLLQYPRAPCLALGLPPRPTDHPCCPGTLVERIRWFRFFVATSPNLLLPEITVECCAHQVNSTNHSIGQITDCAPPFLVPEDTPSTVNVGHCLCVSDQVWYADQSHQQSSQRPDTETESETQTQVESWSWIKQSLSQKKIKQTKFSSFKKKQISNRHCKPYGYVSYWPFQRMLKKACYPSPMNCCIVLISRPGGSQGLLYKHLSHSLIDSFSNWPFSPQSFTAPPRPNG